MELQESDALSRFAREHHMHYEVEAQAQERGGSREWVGYEVRLFATHGESKLEAPGCPRCVELLGELRTFAEQLVAAAAERVDVTPLAPALYESTEVRGADEVAVAVRVYCDSPEHRRAGPANDPCLGDVRGRLEEVGVPRR